MRWLLLILLFSCAQRIKAPINRMISPESMGRGLELEYRKSGYSRGLLDWSEGKTTNPLNLTTVSEEELYMALGVTPAIDLFFKQPAQSVAMLGLKAQVIGGPSSVRDLGHKLSFAFSRGSNSDSFEGGLDLDLSASMWEILAVHGYRLSPRVLLYDGISYTNYEFSGKIKNAGSLMESNRFKYSARGTLGAHAGVEFGGPNFKAKLEYAVQRIHWSRTPISYHHSLGYALSMTF